MKRQLMLFVITLLTSGVYAQQYFNFPVQDAIWSYRVVGSINPPYDWTRIDSLGGVITIDTIQYTEVYQESYVAGGIREDTFERKVYFNDFSQEILLYDFSVNIGDTVFYPSPINNYKVVQDIDSLLVGGQYRKRFHLVNMLYGMPDTWIEGIGSVYRLGLLNPYYPDIVLDGSTPYFGCFRHDTIVYIDGNTCYGSCPCSYWLVDIDESVQGNNDNITVMMDASNNILRMYMKDTDKYQFINLFDCRGQLISSHAAESGNIKIDVSKLTGGIYLIKVCGNGKNITYRFNKI